MALCTELILVSAGETPDRDRGVLAELQSFAQVRPVHFTARSETIDLGVDGWLVAIEQRDGEREMTARKRQWPGYRLFASAGGIDELEQWIASDDALSPLADARLSPGVTRELECVEWRGLGAQGIRAILCIEAGRPDALRLVGPVGSTEALFAIAREVLERVPFLIAPFGETESGEPVRAEKTRLAKHESAAHAFFLIGVTILAHWFGNDAAARHGLEAEQVHQLRVAQRRLKTALKLFPERVNDAWIERIAPDLKWFGDLLADARDWDVFTDTTLAHYAASDDTPARWQATRDAANEKRMAAREAVADALRSPRYARLALAFVTWLCTLETHEDEQRESLAEHARKRIRKHYRRIARSPDLTTLDAPTRHRVRIHAKRLRYALEFFRSIVTSATRREVAKRLGTLQSVLGDGNDAAVAAQRLADLPQTDDYQKGLAKGFAVATQRASAAEGERVLRKIKQPRIKASL
jgi:CHAD domain-containing protein